ncbi:hypothetical protein GCM10022393_34960 [Aquimarina addita]|uniref:HTH LytTR-type domain-containing protein n=1 Tax=Aquimarina addita TaxID=870485 RepID=A0ABP6UQA5_9FLAO
MHIVKNHRNQSKDVTIELDRLDYNIIRGANGVSEILREVIRSTSDLITLNIHININESQVDLGKKINPLYKGPVHFSVLGKNKVDEKKEYEKDSNIIFIKSGNKLMKVNINDILFAHTDSKNYCSLVISGDKKLSVRYSILKLSQQLKSSLFVQTHRSYIINWQKIDSFHEYDQTIQIEGHHIPVGRTFKNDIYTRLRVI